MIMADFFMVIADDARITVTHISLYLALLNEWQIGNLPETMEIDRVMIMEKAKISARSTYDKTMHDLADFGYIRYFPFNGCGRSRVKFRKL